MKVRLRSLESIETRVKKKKSFIIKPANTKNLIKVYKQIHKKFTIGMLVRMGFFFF